MVVRLLLIVAVQWGQPQWEEYDPECAFEVCFRRVGGMDGIQGRAYDDLLAFSRMGRAAMRFTDIDMKNMANAVYYKETNAQVRKRITFTIADLSKAQGDTNMMRLCG